MSSSLASFVVGRFKGRSSDHSLTVKNCVVTRANMLTLAGILAVGFYVYQVTFLFLVWSIPITNVFIILTDVLDGILADKYDEHTTLGKFLDPLRDRLHMTAVLWNALLFGGGVVACPVIVAVVFEIALLLCAILYYHNFGKVTGVHFIGKLRALISWVAGMVLVIMLYWFEAVDGHALFAITMTIAIASVSAFVGYGLIFVLKIRS